MKNLSILLLVCASFFVAGCSGMVDSPSERALRYRTITNLQTRMLVDDWDYLWLYERNTYMTYWHPRVGK